MFINQGRRSRMSRSSTARTPSSRDLAQFFSTNVASTQDRMRFGIALGGAAYLLATMESLPSSTCRTASSVGLISIMGELLAARPPRTPRTTTMATLLYRLGRFSYRHAWRVIGAWMLVLVATVGTRHRARRPDPGVVRDPRHRVAGGARPARRRVPVRPPARARPS